MIWDENKLKILEHELGAFSVSIRCKVVEEEEEWVFVGVYRPPNSGEVDDFLSELDNVHARWNLPWCLRGDFNLIRFSHERKGINVRYRKMVSFGNFINRWRLVDYP